MSWVGEKERERKLFGWGIIIAQIYAEYIKLLGIVKVEIRFPSRHTHCFSARIRKLFHMCTALAIINFLRIDSFINTNKNHPHLHFKQTSQAFFVLALELRTRKR